MWRAMVLNRSVSVQELSLIFVGFCWTEFTIRVDVVKSVKLKLMQVEVAENVSYSSSFSIEVS